MPIAPFMQRAEAFVDSVRNLMLPEDLHGSTSLKLRQKDATHHPNQASYHNRANSEDDDEDREEHSSDGVFEM